MGSRMYIGTDRDPIAKQIELYQDLLASLTDRGGLNQNKEDNVVDQRQELLVVEP